MVELSVQLPGGLLYDEQIFREAIFRPLCGEVEMALQEAACEQNNIPGYVTTVLARALANVGGIPSDTSVIRRLGIADRRYLMLRLAALLEGDLFWLEAECRDCHKRFDVRVARSELPVKKSGPGYPVVLVDIGRAELECRLPVGADQENIIHLQEQDALNYLLKTCITTVNGTKPADDFISSLTDTEIDRIEKAMEDVSPVVTLMLLTHCPECGKEQVVPVDPYILSGAGKDNFYHEIHTLAWTYHWSEQEILALPRERRRIYLRLIDRSRGMYD